ncbi:hypothetical protein PIB30_080308 [Stylosanthes scabra]|uniref:Transmembrane protein n=1 Tax=Stylosanthes scabra TaxID=79078 RepID=A0ABU6ZPZ8_9FABA|nr:hypothetical protein [Stylosanthes scabra]
MNRKDETSEDRSEGHFSNFSSLSFSSSSSMISSSYLNSNNDSPFISGGGGGGGGGSGRLSLIMAAVAAPSTPAVVFTALAGLALVAVIFYGASR